MSETKFFTYKGFPLVRKGKQIYYGNMSDETVALLTILSTHKVKDMDVADKIRVQHMRTAQNIDASEMIIKTSERSGLYEALDVANIWLTRS